MKGQNRLINLKDKW